MFGFRLDENFDRPYLSTTPSQFWTRWHMSLSFWIRDYLFLPLAMLRREAWWRIFMLVVSMVVFGLWHKGALLFAIWGLYQGALLVLHRQWQQLQHRFGWELPRVVVGPLSWTVTFGFICLGWVFFRASGLTQALTMLRAVANPVTYANYTLPVGLFLLVSGLALGYFVTMGIQRLFRKHWEHLAVPLELRVALYSVAVYVGVLHAAQTQAFIYFQF